MISLMLSLFDETKELQLSNWSREACSGSKRHWNKFERNEIFSELTELPDGFPRLPLRWLQWQLRKLEANRTSWWTCCIQGEACKQLKCQVTSRATVRSPIKCNKSTEGKVEGLTMRCATTLEVLQQSAYELNDCHWTQRTHWTLALLELVASTSPWVRWDTRCNPKGDVHTQSAFLLGCSLRLLST